MQDTNTIRENIAVRDLLFSPRGIKSHTHMKPRKENSTQTQTESESEPEPEFKQSTKCTVVANPTEDMCGVCLEVTETKNVSVTSCGHRFCTTCLLMSLQHKNTCPTCRSSLEPPRKEPIEQLNATTAAEIIQNEEREIDIQRRAAIIEAFGNGRKAMIVALCREFAFGVAHSIAGWQGTSDTTYHASWNDYEYNEYNDDDDDDDNDDDHEHDDDDATRDGDESDGHDDDGDDDDDDDQNQNQNPDLQENESELLRLQRMNHIITSVTPLQEHEYPTPQETQSDEGIVMVVHADFVKHMLFGLVYISMFILANTIKNIM
jgi:hypothetical protein